MQMKGNMPIFGRVTLVDLLCALDAPCCGAPWFLDSFVL